MEVDKSCLLYSLFADCIFASKLFPLLCVFFCRFVIHAKLGKQLPAAINPVPSLFLLGQKHYGCGGVN